MIEKTSSEIRAEITRCDKLLSTNGPLTFYSKTKATRDHVILARIQALRWILGEEDPRLVPE